MSFNVAGSSTRVPSDLPLFDLPSSDLPLPKVEEVEKYTPEQLSDFLKRKLEGLDNHIKIITDQEVNGKTFLDFTAIDFERWGIPGGPAKQIEKLIKEIQGVAGPIGSSSKVEDKTLTDFWNALKGTTFPSGDDLLILPDDTHFFGINNEPLRLFVRKCYCDLLGIALDTNVRNLRITGNPGIGKTFYGYYILYELAKINKTVIYDSHTRTRVMLFEQNKAFYLSRTQHDIEITRYLEDPNVWRIVDGKTDKDTLAKTILICSPLKSNYKEFDKFSPSIRYMPVWSWEEIDLCRNYVYRDLTNSHVRKLYNKWGGIPRYVLQNAHKKEIQDQLRHAIDSCSEKIFNYIGETESKADVSHKLVHIWTNIPKEDILTERLTKRDKADEAEASIPIEYEAEASIPIEYEAEDSIPIKEDELDEENLPREPYTEKIILFASDYVGGQVTYKLENLITDELVRNLRKNLKSGKSDQFLGICFEHLAHQKFQNGGKFEVRSLEPGEGNEGKILHETLKEQEEILTFSKIEEIEDDKYYRPESPIFPSFDAIRAPDTLFQMTTTMYHPIKLIGLEKVQSKLAPTGEISFYFVVPSQLYDTYRKQSFSTINDTIAKRVPRWIKDRIKQYALKIDLSSGGLPRTSSTVSIEEGISNILNVGESSTRSTVSETDESVSSIPAKRSQGGGGRGGRGSKKRVKH